MPLRSSCILLIVFLATTLHAQDVLGVVQDNTNEALPSSYNFKEYVFPEPDDAGTCTGATNATAVIDEVFLAQTHRHAVGHPLFFTIGARPAFLQVAVTGSGASPDVQVTASRNGTPLGNLCLSGPSELPATLNLDDPTATGYFSVTLPEDWIKDGLELTLSAGAAERVLTPSDLKIGPYTEMNLVMVNMDVMDYNLEAHAWPIFETFLQEMASAIPASKIRFGVFPEVMPFPEVVSNNDEEQMVRLRTRRALNDNGITNEGYMNAIPLRFLGSMHRGTGDYLSTIYFGNTLNLAPGGWGGGSSFVSFDFTDVFIHELGHALSLPHWGDSYANDNAQPWEFNYPYGGENNDGGGRGEAWSFIQSSYQFVDPTCRNGDNLGRERSDAMQRSNKCDEQRGDDIGPWDGFSDFSALAIHRYLVGGAVESGQVLDRGELRNFQLRQQEGFPTVSLEGGRRVYTRDPLQPETPRYEEVFELPGEEQLEQDVYLIYGSAHENQSQANIVYRPIKYRGTLPPVVDPTDPATLAALREDRYGQHFRSPRDIVLKLIYEDGSVQHALYPYGSFDRAPYTWTFNIWRTDVHHYALAVPGDKPLAKVEVYHRPFLVSNDQDDTPGNINYPPFGITADNFMNDAVYQTEYDFGSPGVLGTNTIGNRVWHDSNQNGLDDNGELGIPGVSLILWEDGDGDGRPDFMGFRGVTKTDGSGRYQFTGLNPGNYLVFVWSVDNWEEGEPLHGMVPTPIFVDDPNTDINGDNNGRPGNLQWGLTANDIVSGEIIITADGEPLNDGDREDDWFDYDPSGNMGIDFGFYVEGAEPTSVDDLSAANIRIFPNPFTDVLTVESPTPLSGKVKLINTKGQLLLTVPTSGFRTQISTTGFRAGLYILVLEDAFGRVVGSRRVVR